MYQGHISGTLYGMLMNMPTAETPQPYALNIGQRMDRLGLGQGEMAELAGVDREAVTRARAGRAQAKTVAKIQAALTRLEKETGADDPSGVIATITLPDGPSVTFAGASPEEAAVAAARFLETRRKTPPPR